MPTSNLYCEWCHGEKNVMPMYIPESPVLEWMEKRIIANDESFTNQKLTDWEEWEMLCYDEMVTAIRRGAVCTSCWKKDQRLYDKYYDSDDDDMIRLL